MSTPAASAALPALPAVPAFPRRCFSSARPPSAGCSAHPSSNRAPFICNGLAPSKARLKASYYSIKRHLLKSMRTTNGNDGSASSADLVLSPTTARRHAAPLAPALRAGGGGGVWERAAAEEDGGRTAENTGPEVPLLMGGTENSASRGDRGKANGGMLRIVGQHGGAHSPVCAQAHNDLVNAELSAPAAGEESGEAAEGAVRKEGEEILSSSERTLANLIISIVGAGVLGLPYAFMRSGWLVSLISLAATAGLTFRGMQLLVGARRLQEEWECAEQAQGEQVTLLQGGKEGSGDLELGVVSGTSAAAAPDAAAATTPPASPTPSPAAPVAAAAAATAVAAAAVALESAQGSSKVRSYGDLAHRLYGAAGRSAVDAMVLISQGGFCAVFLVFMGHNVSSVISGSTHFSPLVIAAIAPFQIMLSWLPSLAQLAPFSLFAVAANLAAFSVVLFYGLCSFEGLQYVSAFTTLHDAPFAFGVATYALSGAGMTLSLESSMLTRSQFPAVLATGLSLISVLYAAVGTVGYLGFGSATEEIVTLNLPPGWQSVLVKLGVCTALFFTFPVMLTPVHEIVARYLSYSPYFQSNFMSPTIPYARRRVFICTVRSLTVLLIVLIAVSVPHIGAFISLLGCSFCSALGFVAPALFHMKAARGKLEGFELMGDRALVGFGVGFGIWGTVNALVQMFS